MLHLLSGKVTPPLCTYVFHAKLVKQGTDINILAQVLFYSNLSSVEMPDPLGQRDIELAPVATAQVVHVTPLALSQSIRVEVVV